MALPVVLGIGNIVLEVLEKFFPNQTEIKKSDIELKKAAIEAEVQIRVNELLLLQKQAETNTAEAANPNRKWITWRELLGYGAASAVVYTLLIRPFMVDILTLLGVTSVKNLPVIDIASLFKLLLGMLGIGS